MNHWWIFVGGMIVLGSMCFFMATHFLKEKPEETIRHLRSDDLVSDSCKRYPELPITEAVAQYIIDMQDEIITLKRNALNTDVAFIIDALSKDLEILRERHDNLISIEIQSQSGFNILHAAQL